MRQSAAKLFSLYTLAVLLQARQRLWSELCENVAPHISGSPASQLLWNELRENVAPVHIGGSPASQHLWSELCENVALVITH